MRDPQKASLGRLKATLHPAGARRYPGLSLRKTHLHRGSAAATQALPLRLGQEFWN
jgi:hypothetical protein